MTYQDSLANAVSAARRYKIPQWDIHAREMRDSIMALDQYEQLPIDDQISDLRQRLARAQQTRRDRYDERMIFPDDVEALRRVLAGQHHFTTASARLMRHGLVDHGLYHVAPNPASHVAVAQVHEGARIRVSKDYPLPLLHGREGIVHSVSTSPEGVCVQVRFRDLRTESLWCFYEARNPISTRVQAFSLGLVKSLSPLPRTGGRWSQHTRACARDLNRVQSREWADAG